MTAVAIVGSRRWSDFDAFCEAMPDLSAYDTIVSGGFERRTVRRREAAGQRVTE